MAGAGRGVGLCGRTPCYARHVTSPVSAPTFTLALQFMEPVHHHHPEHRLGSKGIRLPERQPQLGVREPPRPPSLHRQESRSSSFSQDQRRVSAREQRRVARPSRSSLERRNSTTAQYLLSLKSYARWLGRPDSVRRCHPGSMVRPILQNS